MAPRRKVGFIHNGNSAPFQPHFAAFTQSLFGTYKSNDIDVAVLWAGDFVGPKTLGVQAKEFVASQPFEVFVAAGGPPTALVLKEAKLNVPVVFMSVADPQGLGLVSDLDRPNTNMTGIAGMTSELDVARLQLLRTFLWNRPSARVAVLVNKNRPLLPDQYSVLEDAARALQLTLERHEAEHEASIRQAFADIQNSRPDALLVTADSLFNNHRQLVVGLARGIPAIYQWREFVEAGGLMSFGPNIMDAYRKVGEYTARLLQKPAPADLPVAVPDRFELVINLRLALREKYLLPASMLSVAEIVG